MRLGAYPCKIHPGTFLEKAYGCGEVQERAEEMLRRS